MAAETKTEEKVKTLDEQVQELTNELIERFGHTQLGSQVLEATVNTLTSKLVSLAMMRTQKNFDPLFKSTIKVIRSTATKMYEEMNARNTKA